MSKYLDALTIMEERFSSDNLIAIATSDGIQLHNRIVDAYYEEGAFYVVTNAQSNKMKQIKDNPDVAVCAVDWFSGHGIATNIGRVLDPKNAKIREKLKAVFSSWYEYANEDDENCCILKITLIDGLLVKDHHALRYQIDFKNKSALLSENWEDFK